MSSLRSVSILKNCLLGCEFKNAIRHQNVKLFNLQRKFQETSKISSRHFATEKSSVSEEELLIQPLDGEQEGILVLSINRPTARNAISKNLVELLTKTLATQSQQKNLRVLILRSSSPGVFCAGADLKERAKMKEEEVGPFVSSLRNMVHKLHNFPLPTIAALDGIALGGGLEIALACDIRVASKTTKMGLVETTLGIIPGAGGTQLLPRLIGASRAKDLIFAGSVFDGEHGKEIGVINHVVTQNEKGDAAFGRSVELAQRMLANGPIALKMAKLAINQGIETNLNDALRIEEKFYGQVIGTKDRTEGLLAFKEKRKPKFIGE